jgi:hypothetical protein
MNRNLNARYPNTTEESREELRLLATAAAAEVVARHQPATGITTKTALTGNDATNPTTFTLNGG